MSDPFINDLLDFVPLWSTIPPFTNEIYHGEVNHPVDFVFYNDMDSLVQESSPFWPLGVDLYFMPQVNSDPPSPPVTPTSPLPKALRRNTRVGYCEHPKHEIYRQPNYPSSSPFQHQFMQECHDPPHCRQLCDHHHFLLHQEGKDQDKPRRGRPPKGTKPTEKNDPETRTKPIAMTTRPLPKRLEAVVGESSIYVCLTCLKRSDLDIDYLIHPAYVGPQSTKKKQTKS